MNNVKQRKRKPRKTELEKMTIKAMCDSGLNENQVAKQLNISPHTVKIIKNDPEILKKANEIAFIKKELPNKMTRLADLAADNAAENIQEMNSYQSAIIAKIAIESSRLIEGQSTANVGVIGLFGIISDSDTDDD